MGFEPTTSAGERPKTYALDRAATGPATSVDTIQNNQKLATITFRFFLKHQTSDIPTLKGLLQPQLVRNVMVYVQKPDFVFPRNGRVHLNRWGRQFSRLLAAEVCASA